ncbi:hypothetical protein [Azospirillum endophyticum]
MANDPRLYGRASCLKIINRDWLSGPATVRPEYQAMLK